MPRYFIEVAYKGTRYAGFQVQQNANTIQGEVKKAFDTLFGASVLSSSKEGWQGTGSSRTDAGVHALQNFFHFNWPEDLDPKKIYNLNAILPRDIAIKSIRKVTSEAHCRFDAISRTYHYQIYQQKNPFLTDIAYFYPYPLDINRLNEAAELLKIYTNFTSFSKRNTQVHNFNCTIFDSRWFQNGNTLIYEVRANRFLRGMVRALTATMLKVGRGIIDMNSFKEIIQQQDATRAFFDTPPQGLFLINVELPEKVFLK